MKFESKFGIGEIVNYLRYKDGAAISDELLEVVGVSFSRQGTLYLCRLPNCQIVNFAECELDGDPKFDQESGCYPPES